MIKLILKTFPILLIAFSIILLLFTIKGTKSSFYNQKIYETAPGSALESSNSSSRFSLVKAIAERGSFLLNKEEAKLASPDVAKKGVNYFSIFMPGVSILSTPLYILGNYFGHSQVSTFMFNVILSVFNLILIAIISQRLGAGKGWSFLSGFVYIFGTNSWVYALGLTQHPLSTLLLLTSLLIILSKVSLKSNLLIGVVYGVGLLVDFPNLITMFPVVLCQMFRNVDTDNWLSVINWKNITMGIGFFPLIAIFIYYNLSTTGSAFSAAQFSGRTRDFATNSQVLTPVSTIPTSGKSTFHLPFNSRELTQGLYILTISNERGLLYYSPVLLIGIFGFYFFSKSREKMMFNKVALSVFGLNLLTYSMFGDPWGGWSFGPRYLIPGMAVIMLYFPFFFISKKYKIIKSVIMLVLAGYSIYISSLGALTTANIPPKQEAEHLTTNTPYTPELNKYFIKTKTSSLFYNLNLSDKISPLNYSYIILLVCFTILASLTIFANKNE